MTEEKLMKAVKLSIALNKLLLIADRTSEPYMAAKWAFLSNPTDKKGTEMPGILKSEFRKAVERSIEIIKKEIEEL